MKKEVMSVGLLSMVGISVQLLKRLIRRLPLVCTLEKNEYEGGFGKQIFNYSQSTVCIWWYYCRYLHFTSSDLSLQGNYGDYGFSVTI